MLAVQRPYQIFPIFRVKETDFCHLPLAHDLVQVSVLSGACSGGSLLLCSECLGRVCVVSCWDVFPCLLGGDGGWITGHSGRSKGYLKILPRASLMSTRSP